MTGAKPPSGVDRSHAPWLLSAAICGAVLRLGWLNELALEHYDEGVYASNLVFLADEGGQFPGRPLFAPPLWPAVIEWFTIGWRMVSTTSPRWLPMLPGLLCGIAVIPSVWLVARRWFGPTAGVSAAWLVALSEYHAFYSRTALTEAPLILAWLWALYWISLALDRADMRTAVIAGTVTALGWWTKYNGWLPLAIGLSGGVAAQILLPANEQTWSRLLRTLAVIVGTAVLCWLPVLWDCQSVGGYAAVAANHRGYLEPSSRWFVNLVHQGQNLDAYFGPVSWLGVVIAVLPMFGLPPHRWRLVGGLLLIVLVAVSAYLLGPALGLLLAGGLAAIGVGLDRWRRDQLSRTEIIAACLLSAWLLGLLLATPMYRPYPRLVMPLWLAGVMGTAWFASQCAAYCRPADFSRNRHVVAAGLTTTLAVGTMFIGGTTVWEDRMALARASDDIAASLTAERTAGDPPVVFVYGEPALFVALRERGVAAGLSGNLGFVDRPPPTATYLVAGLFADRDAGFQEEWSRVQDRFVAVKSWSVRPSSLVLLDNLSPAELRDGSPELERTLTLYRLTPR
ncbi:MAG: glycosyltransferase family 39 protein [Planctomycetaceae bacterium]|nr:glycosyltransferase family 39 protein [Planctomycetaceae bacterium]